MNVLKFDLNIPFWCSFKDFGSVSSHLTYPFPPPPTIFGMILNALGKPALHTIEKEVPRIKLMDEYFQAYKNIRFALIVREKGVKIDDYANILKRNRCEAEIEQHFPKFIKRFLIQNFPFLNDFSLDKLVKTLSKYKTYEEKKIEEELNKYSEIFSSKDISNIQKFISGFWDKETLQKRKERNSEKHLTEKLKSLLLQEYPHLKNLSIDNIINPLKKFKNYREKNIEAEIDKFSDVFSEKERNLIANFIYNYWEKDRVKIKLAKYWQRTQIIRQRIVGSRYTVLISSESTDQYSLQNIQKKLFYPERPLYCGESDDMADIIVYDICSPNSQKSNRIQSVLPGLYSNSIITNIPIALRNQQMENPRKIISIPKGKIDNTLDCHQVEGENFVFI